MSQDKFFTTIRRPRRFRKHLLESSKEAILVLKEYQEILSMREKKKAKIGELKQQFDELMALMDELDDYLPEESLDRLKEMMPEQEEEPEPEDDGEAEGEDEDDSADEGGSEGGEEDSSEDEGEEGKEQKPEEEMSEEEKKMARLESALDQIEGKLKDI